MAGDLTPIITIGSLFVGACGVIGGWLNGRNAKQGAIEAAKVKSEADKAIADDTEATQIKAFFRDELQALRKDLRETRDEVKVLSGRVQTLETEKLQMLRDHDNETRVLTVKIRGQEDKIDELTKQVVNYEHANNQLRVTQGKLVDYIQQHVTLAGEEKVVIGDVEIKGKRMVSDVFQSTDREIKMHVETMTSETTSEIVAE